MTETALPLEITPHEVQRRLQAGEKLALIDVREPGEFQLMVGSSAADIRLTDSLLVKP